ncbi:hypothetical protein BpHYR1_026641 [Brachionus plicatilis]|uniref:Uncharacterized protein n=1 Tax=Brachionus plicatilis TaxID=10195 RepID=A0A3M7RMZ4_BRAPC|nr:hypothetical protein BpHYR1_026641 [Brachionus plicatilis]
MSIKAATLMYLAPNCFSVLPKPETGPWSQKSYSSEVTFALFLRSSDTTFYYHPKLCSYSRSKLRQSVRRK